MTHSHPPEFSTIRQSTLRGTEFHTRLIRQKMRSEFGREQLCSSARRRFGNSEADICSFARKVMTGNGGHDQPGLVAGDATPCFNKQDGVIPNLLKPPPITGAKPPHGIRFARSPDVAKPEIEQFLANRSGAGPWPGRCSGYGWLLLVMRGRADAYAWSNTMGYSEKP